MEISETSSIESDSEGNVSFVCKPVFNECSDLPNLSRIGIFSCDKCDRWRNRVHNNRQSSKSRSEMPSLQCTRAKRRRTGIRIKVSFNNNKPTALGPQAFAQAQLVASSLQPLPIQHAERKSFREKKQKKIFEVATKAAVKKKFKGKISQAQDVKVKMNTKASNEEAMISKAIRAQEVKLRLEKQLEHNRELNDLQVKLKRAKQETYEIRSKIKTKELKGKTAEQQLCHAIEQSCSEILPGKHCKTKAAVLMSALQSGELLKGEVSAALCDITKKTIQHMFRPSRLLKACDLGAIGSFRTGTVEALREIIDEDKQGYFASPTALSRARVSLDNHATRLVGWRREDTKYGEVFFLNKEKTLRLLLKACNLHELATKESIKISMSIDGADLVRDRTHVSAGIKITDERGIHPVTKQPLLTTNDDGDEIFVNVQSYQVCCIMIIADARDKKELYEDVFRDFYAWGNQLASHGLPAADGEPALRPFTLTHTSDMKAQWLLSNRGGGCKNKRFFCTFCSCPKEKLLGYKEGEDRCNRCKRRNKNRCYHHHVCDTITTSRLLEELNIVLGQYKERHGKMYAEVKKESKLKTDHMEANKAANVKHIDFSIQHGSSEQVRQYAQFISRECMIRGIPLIGSVADWQAALKCSVFMERCLELLELTEQWHESGRTTIPLVEVVEILIPCILHLENRLNEKIITMILRSGFDRHNGPKMGFISDVQHCIQRLVLGTETKPSQWKLKYSQPTNEPVQLENVQFRNQVGRGFMKKIDTLIEYAITDEALRIKLVHAISLYTQGMCILTLHRSLEEEEKELFQDYMDDFFEEWIAIYGIDGMSNYMHMLGSGHMLYFLQKYNCLYLYSQQGWEALNNRIQAYIHQNSGRGGRNTGVNGGQSYIFPLVRFVLRDLLWKTGEADRFFAEIENVI